jgi:hypothetical protein
VEWRLLIEFVVAIGYGVLSSVVPIFNAEIYIVASQVGGFTEEVTTAVGCAIGQTIGKVGTVLALRQGRSSRLVRKVRERPRKPAGRVRTKLRAWSDRMMGLLGERRWGVPIVLLSACVGLPPLYAVTLAVPATKMSVILFGAAVLLGAWCCFWPSPSGSPRCSTECFERGTMISWLQAPMTDGLSLVRRQCP